MSAERLRERCPTTRTRVRQLAWSVVILGLFACGEDQGPGRAEDDGQHAAADSGTPSHAGASDAAAGSTMTTGSTSSASSTPSTGATGSSGERDAGMSAQSQDAAAPNRPEPELDASIEAGPAGEGGAPFDPGESPPDAAMPRQDLGVGDGKDVITIGDSWMQMFTNSGGIEGALERAGKRYRNYAVPGTTLAGQIPSQYTSAKRANPDIKTVIMTGGGNDIMFSGACNTSADSCAEAGEMIVMRLNTLWTQMAQDGVKDVVYIQYAASAGTARMRPDGGASGNATVPICASGKIRCHSIATSDLVSDRDLPDGIHPNRAANDRIAKRILETMEMRGVRR